MSDIHVFVGENPLDISALMQKVQSDAHGAIDIFVGTVRNTHEGKSVTGINYDAHVEIAKKVFKEICAESQGLWPNTKYAVSHFKGELPVGGISIVIAVSSPHRAESFEACRYVIEEIKIRAPSWKQEHYIDGKSAWLPGHSLNEETKANQKCCGGQHG
ncbi:MAG: molybdenum cofactor biosynthesis protein MoaE [Verrucomicrobia subdivision 3 bacterium]|nr:molybdenum cofactor biosynthesis protein MoaE [Limisphaerales bacterium]